MPAEVWTMWFRRDRSQPWACVFTGGSSYACTCALADSKLGSGDYYPKRGSDAPRGGSLCWDRKPRKADGD